MRVGLLGAGQLAGMLADAGIALGMKHTFLSPDPDSCAAPRGDFVCGDFDDVRALTRFTDGVDVVTYEFENVPVAAAEWCADRIPVRPPVAALRVAQDRLAEKQSFQRLDIPVPAYAAVNSLDELHRAVGRHGVPAVLKTRTLGYDGKGQVVLRDTTADSLSHAWDAIGRVPAILEEFVPFERELSVVAVRALDGAEVFYPLNQNWHREGILRLTVGRAGDPRQDLAEEYARRLLADLDYVGTLTLELFEVSGRLLANELAPRVHNSGHWTIEGATTSQFENHMRAICGLPLGPTGQPRPAAMVNLVGSVPDRELVRRIPGAVLHAYGKSESPGRKVGHITLTGEEDEQDRFMSRVARALRHAGEAGIADAIDPGGADALGRVAQFAPEA